MPICRVHCWSVCKDATKVNPQILALILRLHFLVGNCRIQGKGPFMGSVMEETRRTTASQGSFQPVSMIERSAGDLVTLSFCCDSSSSVSRMERSDPVFACWASAWSID
ncbi:hypothetical protein L1887_16438 [Cichorium endivia]|nr:hypothetical protein L1887_16438 [Cichorium endivia]